MIRRRARCGDIPRDGEGNPVFFILPDGLREQYSDLIKSCEKGWRATGDPWVIAEAVTLNNYYRQTLPVWLKKAVWSLADRHRTKAHAKRAQEAAVRFARYMAVRDFHGDGMAWEAAYAEAERVLEAKAAAAAADTMRAAYKTVSRDLKSGRSGRYFSPKRQHRNGNGA